MARWQVLLIFSLDEELRVSQAKLVDLRFLMKYISQDREFYNQLPPAATLWRGMARV
jgi:hypothetical protein